MMNEKDRCDRCIYFKPRAGTTSGKCRKYPPTVFMVGASVVAEYPEVGPYDWCGEFKLSYAMPKMREEVRTDMKAEIRAELMKCAAIERLLVEHETVNPDVITPNELEEIVEKMDDLYHD